MSPAALARLTTPSWSPIGVAATMTVKEVAARTYISTHTAAHHLREAFRKLYIAARVELARIVIEEAAAAGS